MMQKGRAKHLDGDAAPWAKLNSSRVREIRALYKEGGMTYRMLAARYGVSATNIQHVVNRHTWRSVLDNETA